MNKKIIISLLLVIIWIGFIYFMSERNGDKSSNDSMQVTRFIVSAYDKIMHSDKETIAYHQNEEYLKRVNGVIRKLAHFFEYFVLSCLMLNFLVVLNKFRMLYINIYNLLFCFLISCLDELHQTFVNGRAGTVKDILIDSGGVMFGLIIFWLIYRLICNKRFQNV